MKVLVVVLAVMTSVIVDGVMDVVRSLVVTIVESEVVLVSIWDPVDDSKVEELTGVDDNIAAVTNKDVLASF